MSHLTEDQLVLHYYGEPVDVPVEDHLAACETCRSGYRRLQRLLNTMDAAPVPEPPPDYGAAVWHSIAPRLHRRRTWAWAGPRRWIFAGAMAGLLAAAFLAGRLTRAPLPQPTAAASGVRERVLLVAVGDHLERTQTILLELANADSPDIGYEREAAADLLESNRLFRLTAAGTGDAATAGLLDDLERTLVEIANSPPEMSRRELRELQREMEHRGILLKVKGFASQVRERETKDQL